MKLVLLLAVFFTTGFLFLFGNVEQAQAYRSCSGQWNGSDIKVDVYNYDTGALITSLHATDPNSTGSSYDSEDITVSSGTRLKFVGLATAPDNGAYSVVHYPYQDPDPWSEGPFQFTHTWNSDQITSADGFSWEIEGVCQGRVNAFCLEWDVENPSFCLAWDTRTWDGGRGLVEVNITVQQATPTGTINVTSNQNTSWLVQGLQNFNGSGQSGSYSGPAGTYSIAADDLTCYSKSINSTSQAVSAGGTITFAITYTYTCGGPTPTPTGPTPTPTGLPISCTDSASIMVLQTAPGTTSVNSSFPVSVRVGNTGDTRWYHGSAYQFVQTSNNGLGLNPTYGHLAYGPYPGDTHDWSFTVTAPATPGTYSATMRMVHRGGIWDYLKTNGSTCPGPGSDIYFGQTFTISATVNNPVGISFNITYTIAPLNTPTITSVSNTPCTKLTVNWDHTSNGTEEYFTVWRSSTGAAGSFSQIYQTPNNTPRSYQDTPPVANQSYYYIVKAHTNVGGVREAASGTFGPTLNQPCSANLNNSSKTLLRVNGLAYSTNTVIKDGDVLTFRVTLNNSGSTIASISYICDTSSANITNIRNLVVTGGTNGGITANSPSCLGAPRLNITGPLEPNVAANWLITFDADFTATSTENYEVCSNIANVYYNDGVNKNKIISFGPILCKPGKGGGTANFREVAP